MYHCSNIKVLWYHRVLTSDICSSFVLTLVGLEVVLTESGMSPLYRDYRVERNQLVTIRINTNYTQGVNRRSSSSTQ